MLAARRFAESPPSPNSAICLPALPCVGCPGRRRAQSSSTPAAQRSCDHSATMLRGPCMARVVPSAPPRSARSSVGPDAPCTHHVVLILECLKTGRDTHGIACTTHPGSLVPGAATQAHPTSIYRTVVAITFVRDENKKVKTIKTSEVVRLGGVLP